MVPTLTSLTEIMQGAFSFTRSMGPVAGFQADLIIDNFIPAPSLDLVPLTIASFPGYPGIVGACNLIQGKNPLTGNNAAYLNATGGALLWVANAPTSPTQTCYGFILTNLDTNVRTYSALLPTPITIANTGDAVEIPSAWIELLQSGVI